MASSAPLDPTKNPFADDDTEEAPTISITQGQGQHNSTGAELTGLEQEQWQAQDGHLDLLSASLNRQHEMSLQMNEELDLHSELLQEFDGDVETTGLHVGRASGQLDKLRRSVKDHGRCHAREQTS